jgi:hypothetical protein
MITGTRVVVKPQSGDSLFADSTGTVIDSVSDIWEVWVKLDIPVIGGYTFGFRENELTILNTPHD